MCWLCSKAALGNKLLFLSDSSPPGKRSFSKSSYRSTGIGCAWMGSGTPVSEPVSTASRMPCSDWLDPGVELQPNLLNRVGTGRAPNVARRRGNGQRIMRQATNTHYNVLISQGSPTPGPRTGTSPRSVRNWATQQEVSGRRASKTSSVFTAIPHRSHYCLSSTSSQHHGKLYNYFIIYYNVIIVEIKCTINVLHLNHPETIPRPPSVEKWSSTKPVPGAKKAGDRRSKHSRSEG